MANNIIIIKKDGTKTLPMKQLQVEKYLGNMIDKNRLANLKQALNDVTGGKGKATGNHTFNNYPVLHASSGNMQKSVSLFYYNENFDHYIIAMGEHLSSKTYKLSDYGQQNLPFKEGAKISL